MLGGIKNFLQAAPAGLAAASMGGSCAGCRQALGFGSYLNALGGTWHSGCFRCAGCQRPIDQQSFNVGQEDGAPYHQECYKQLFHPTCTVCNAHVPTRPDGRIEWKESPFWKERHCPSHSQDGTPSCCACGRLQKRGLEGVGLNDGRHLCLQCLDSIVVDTKDAQPLYDEVRVGMRAGGDESLNPTVLAGGRQF